MSSNSLPDIAQVNAEQVRFADASQLLESVVAIGRTVTDLAEQRRAFVSVLANSVQADAGWWAWGRGRPDADADSVTPVAIVDFGFTDQQRVAAIEWALSRDSHQDFRRRIMPRIIDGLRATTLYQDIFSEEEWAAMPGMRRQLAYGGWESWLHSIRYSASDTWSVLFFLRNQDRGEFGRPESTLIDLAMTSVAWLHSTIEELLPPETFIGLTPRQRAVMLMLLDGLSRKTIGHQLGITEDTVGDHIKAIFIHFDVSSATALAALFLRGK